MELSKRAESVDEEPDSIVESSNFKRVGNRCMKETSVGAGRIGRWYITIGRGCIVFPIGGTDRGDVIVRGRGGFGCHGDRVVFGWCGSVGGFVCFRLMCDFG